jgi:hypothetical protein
MILFCEYVIPQAHSAAFADWIQSHSERWQGVKLLENIGQPGIYVEIWSVNTPEQAAEIEKERREGRSWREMEQWVKGGREGLRIWAFRMVNVTEEYTQSRMEECN